jgi:hypothetical protein
MRQLPFLWALSCVLGLLSFGIGCADDAKKAPTSRPGDSALRDPFGYKPFNDDTDISGGSISHYDHQAMQKDLKHVFDP